MFISPPLVDKGEETFSMEEILTNKSLSNPVYSKIMGEYTTTPPTKSGHKKYLDDGEYKEDIFKQFDFQQGQLLEKCTGFGGTKITADVYLFVV